MYPATHKDRIRQFMELRYAMPKLERTSQFGQSSADASQRMKMNGEYASHCEKLLHLKEFPLGSTLQFT